MRSCKERNHFTSMFLWSESNCSLSDSQHRCLFFQFVPLFVILKRKTMKQLLQNFVLRSFRPRCFWTHSIISTATPCSQRDGFRQPVTGWLIDYYPEGFALPMSGTGQAPRITGGGGGDGRLMSLSFTPSSLLFSPLSLGNSLTSTHLLLLLICRVFGALGKFEWKNKNIIVLRCVLNIHTDWFGSVSVRFIILNSLAGTCLAFFSGSLCSSTSGQQGSMVSFQSAESSRWVADSLSRWVIAPLSCWAAESLSCWVTESLSRWVVESLSY